MDIIEIHTDGSCIGNPGPGGWAAILSGAVDRVMTGNERFTTNNRMEIMAPLAGLDSLDESHRVIVYSDSAYVVNAARQWIHDWKRHGWMHRERKRWVPVKNTDLWQRLDAACAKHDVEWRLIRGHSGIPGNERADRLAFQAAQMQITRPLAHALSHVTM
jgi:ribonuclease HI